MPDVTAVRTLGASLGFGDSKAGPFTIIARIRDFKIPSIVIDEFEVSAHDNATGFKEWVLSLLKDIEEFNFDISYIPTEPSHNITAGLRYLNRYGIKKDWQIGLNTEMGSGTVGFAAYVKKFDGPGLPVNGVATATITMKPTDYYDVTE